MTNPTDSTEPTDRPDPTGHPSAAAAQGRSSNRRPHLPPAGPPARARVTTALSAAQALHLLDTQGFDVALVDMVMPEMDGPALAQHIHERFAAITARMPIIALTANTLPQEHERCLAAGMSDVLHKPLDAQALLHTVARQIIQHRSGHALED